MKNQRLQSNQSKLDSKYKKGIVVEVRNGNVEKAMRVLKKKLQDDGIFNDLRNREFFMSRGEKKRKEKAAGKRRAKKALQKRLIEQGY